MSASTKASYCLVGHRAIDVIGAGTAGAELVVTRLKPSHRHVDRIPVHDRRDRVEERQRVLVGQFANGLGQRRRGERPGRDDDVVPVGRRQAGDFAAPQFESGDDLQALTAAENPSRSTASAPPAGTWLASAARMMRDERRASRGSRPDRVIGGVVGAKGIRAHEFGKALGAVRLGHSGNGRIS